MLNNQHFAVLMVGVDRKVLQERLWKACKDVGDLSILDSECYTHQFISVEIYLSTQVTYSYITAAFPI